MTRRSLLVVPLLLGLAAVLPAAAASPHAPTAEPGVTATTVLIGGTVPLSGPESAYAPVGRGAEAYFKYVNSRGGVHGRRIVYKVIDDAYDPSRTVQATRQLVLQDKVFAIFNSVGTEHVLAVRPLLNQLGVPQLFVGSGAREIARNSNRFPWTMGYLPSFFGEGHAYGRYVARTRPRARIALLHENSGYGRELTAGLRAGLGARARQIVETQTYEVTDVDINSQMARLRSSRADTLMLLALPKQAIQGFVAADRLGWRPRIFLTSVSLDPAVMEIARDNTDGRTTEGAIGMAFLKDPTDPKLTRDPGVRLYRQVMRRHLPGGQTKAVAHLYGMAAAFTMVDALRKAGKNLTRRGLLRAATRLDERNNPFLRRGIRVKTSLSDRYPIEQVQLLRYTKNRWAPFGKVVSLRR